MYTNRIQQERQAKSKKRKRKQLKLFLLTLLTLFFFTILAILFFKSSYSKITEIAIIGEQLLSEKEAIANIPIKKGDSFFFFRYSAIKDPLLKFPEVKDVTIERDFPGLITIYIKEYPVHSFLLDGKMLIPVTSAGRKLERRAIKQQVVNKPIITSWKDEQLLRLFSQEISKLNDMQLASVSEIKYEPNSAYPDRLHLFTNEGHEIYTTISDFASKFRLYPAILQRIQREAIDQYLLTKEVETKKSKDELLSALSTEEKQTIISQHKGVIYLLDSTWFTPYKKEKKESSE